MKKNIYILINNHKKEFNDYYEALLRSLLTNNELSKAIFYGAFNGGKRIRPFLLETFAKFTNVSKKHYFRVSAAVECIHAYSLIHDDLPSMDNDDFRRGKPSLHKKFNEAQAILAGDSLHDISFELLSDKKTFSNSKIRLDLIKYLSISIGSKGLAGGQSLDLIFENKKTTINKILEMYKMKTSSLFSFCCAAPLMMGKENKKDIEFAKQYGNIFGIIFQIIDDYLDEISHFDKIGKTPGKDKKQGKNTLIKYLNKKEIIPFCEKKVSHFIKNNNKYFNKWNILEDILFSIIKI